MTRTRLANLLDHFATLPDPRVERTKRHDLLEIIVLAVCAILAGCNEYTAIEAFGKAKEKWLRTFLKLANGIPSHDTIGRVLAALDPAVVSEPVTSSMIRRLSATARTGSIWRAS